MAPTTAIRKARARLLPVAPRPEVALAHGEGAYVWDREGRRYLDFASGWHGNLLGHDAPVLVRALGEAARAPLARPARCLDEATVAASRWLVDNSFADSAFLAAGSEAARRLAGQLLAEYRRGRDEARDEIIVVGEDDGGWAASGPARFVRPGDGAAVAAALSERTNAIVYAPCLHQLDTLRPSEAALDELAALAHAGRALFVVDESGMPWGRGGRTFTWTGSGARPDLAVVGRGMAGGLPFGALLAGADLSRAATRLAAPAAEAASPLAALAALATARHVQEEGLLAQADRVAQGLARELARVVEQSPHRLETRSVGLAHQLRVEGDPEAVLARARERGLLLARDGGDALYLLPPLTIQRGHAKAAAEALR